MSTIFDLHYLSIFDNYREVHMEEYDYGYIKIKLDQLLRDKKISKNRLEHRAEMQRTQINNYCHETITRLDTAVLARICHALDCKIEDLLEFVPKESIKENHQ